MVFPSGIRTRTTSLFAAVDCSEACWWPFWPAANSAVLPCLAGSAGGTGEIPSIRIAHLDFKRAGLYQPRSPGYFLLEQLQNALLHLVGLGQCRDTRGVQDLVLGQVGNFGRDVGRPDSIFRLRQVLHLSVDDVAGCLQTIDVGADCTTLGSDGRDRRSDVGQFRLGICGAREIAAQGPS